VKTIHKEGENRREAGAVGSSARTLADNKICRKIRFKAEDIFLRKRIPLTNVVHDECASGLMPRCRTKNAGRYLTENLRKRRLLSRKNGVASVSLRHFSFLTSRSHILTHVHTFPLYGLLSYLILFSKSVSD